MARRAAPKRATSTAPSRGRRKAARKPVHRRPHFVVPTILLVVTLAVGSTSAGWISGLRSTPRLSPAPTLYVDPSPSIEPSQLPSVTPGPVLSFATWNIAKPTNTAVPKWGKRRLAMARTINQSLADVIALQEADNVAVTGEGGRSEEHTSELQSH